MRNYPLSSVCFPSDANFAAVGGDPLFTPVLIYLETDPVASGAFRVYRQDIAYMYRLLDINPASLRIFA